MQRRIETLEGEAKPGGPKGMPGIKPKSGRQQTPREKGPREKGPRKPRPHGFARLRMTPTHRVEHALESCPECGTGLAGGWGQRTREIIDLPLVPVQVTEHSLVRICPVCERRVPKSDLGGAALGKQRLGCQSASVIAALREQGRLGGAASSRPEDAASVGAQSGVNRGGGSPSPVKQPAVTDTRPSEPARWPRRTGWREDGVNLGLDFQHPHRAVLPRANKELVDEALGDSFDGVLVSLLRRLPPLPRLQRCPPAGDIHDLRSSTPGTPVGGGSPPHPLPPTFDHSQPPPPGPTRAERKLLFATSRTRRRSRASCRRWRSRSCLSSWRSLMCHNNAADQACGLWWSRGHPTGPTVALAFFGLAPVPQGPCSPQLLLPVKRCLTRYTVPKATSKASATWGAGQPSSLLRRTRALAVTRAGCFPTRIRRWSSSRRSGTNRTAYLSLTITATPAINTSHQAG